LLRLNSLRNNYVNCIIIISVLHHQHISKQPTKWRHETNSMLKHIRAEPDIGGFKKMLKTAF